VRKIFLVKEQFVKLFSEPHSMGIREHHSHTIANNRQGVNTFLFIIFTMSASKSRSTLISLYSDIYHTKYGKNIISRSYAIDISLCIDICHIAYGIAIPATRFPFSGDPLK
jgi:predicted proteasome-type protease